MSHYIPQQNYHNNNNNKFYGQEIYQQPLQKQYYQDPPTPNKLNSNLNLQYNNTNNNNYYSNNVSPSPDTPYPLNDGENYNNIQNIERQKIVKEQRDTTTTPYKQNKTVTSPPKLISKTSENSIFSNTSTIYLKELAYFQYFGHNYNQVINDSSKNIHFSPYIQLKWAITLFVFSFHLPFIQHYNINCVELHRPLNDKELQHNSRIILEHAMKVTSRLCASLKTEKRDYPNGYPMALYFMGQLYSQRLDFDFLLGFFENDPIGAQQCDLTKIEYNDLLKNLQVSLSKNKILPLNDSNAFKYYEKCYNSLHLAEEEGEDSSSDWILCGVSNLFRLSVSLEYGKGCDVDTFRSLKLFYEGWKDWKDPVSGYKLSCKIIKEDDNYDVLEKMKVLLNHNDLMKLALKVLKELDSAQSNFEMGKFYEKNFNEENFDEYDPDLLSKLILKSYLRAFELDYNLASWKLGQIYEFGFYNQPVDMIKSLNFYFKDTSFPLNCLSISGWLLTGNKAVGFLPDDKESFKWLLQAYRCNNGDRYNKILYALGTYYQFGIGCQIDMAKSEQFMLKAAKLGHEKAEQWLKENS
ncbi:hypothetical protein HANVADRAFT_52450 [Hanseniaspora valbyensis NRRL Y-1626]|uniref:HCP-like protein n=1 Tax=Hanseniaspora valbyensis NRRL Y-1626 TaxID=766949 RepID=A0A1B7TEK9_9ASCO|nr:hypothetical protein HANVADRAFT_52450 [Hanseniaspora valbyensis NRRL Y-1626]